MQNAGLDVSSGTVRFRIGSSLPVPGAGPPPTAIRGAESSRIELRRQAYAMVRAAKAVRVQPLAAAVVKR